MSSDTASVHPDKKAKQVKPPDPLAEALANAPEDVTRILGGHPVPVPAGSQAARRVSPRPAGSRPGREAEANGARDGRPARPVRAANPLFDRPAPLVERAADRIRSVRDRFGAVAAAIEAALADFDTLGETDRDAVATAAAREGYDLVAAGAVAAELRDFIDRHKPARA